MAEGGEAIKVAVRVRPFNQREISMNAECIVRMVQNTTVFFWSSFISVLTHVFSGSTVHSQPRKQ